MKRKTTYIIGAGASVSFGFPVGRTLTEEISFHLRSKIDPYDGVELIDKIIRYAIQKIPYPEAGREWNPNYLHNAAVKIAKNMPLAPSIDNYLEAKKDRVGYSEIGKIAISHAILGHERKSSLWFDRFNDHLQSPDFAKFGDNWLSALFRILTAQKGLEGFRLALRSSNFVTFNFDRVIEKFFFEAVKSYFDLTDDQAWDVLDQDLNVAHVYGSLGSLKGPNSVPFGSNGDSQSVYDGSRKIRTFSEGVRDERDISQAGSWCHDSETVIFMGFAFLPLNMRVLSPNDPFGKKRVYGTSLGLSSDNSAIAKNILSYTWFNDPQVEIDFRAVRCEELISQISGYLGEEDLFA